MSFDDVYFGTFITDYSSLAADHMEEEEELEDLIGSNPEKDMVDVSQSIEIGNSSAWATASAKSAASSQQIDTANDSGSSVWKHAADELRAKKQSSDQADSRVF